MKRRACLRALTTFAAAALVPRARGAQSSLPRLIDLRDTRVQIERQRAPLIVLFSVPGCPFCHEVRQHYLLPRLALHPSQIVLGEVDITSERALTEVDGRATTERAWATRLGFRVAPVVAAFDGRIQLIGEPLIGLDRSGFYDAYLSALIEKAQRALR